MCGIAGLLSFNNNHPLIQSKDIQRMLSAIEYRGPDESGIYIGDHIGLGNVRLSIIDLKTGLQPVSDESGRYWIVYNGEVFNYLELKDELMNLGYSFNPPFRRFR